MEGFVQIHPHVDFETFCPFTGSTLAAVDWTVPGQWTFAALRHPETGKTYWTDVPYGVGLLAPCFIDVEKGDVVRPAGGRWYADVTRAAWHDRSDRPVRLRVERRRTARKACLVNCLNPYWGDAVSLLLRINELRARPDLDIIVLATANLAWLIPDFVAEAWLLEDSLSSTSIWNEGLAAEVKALVSATDACYVPMTFQPARLTAPELFEFTGVQPFPRPEWNARLRVKPTVTFVWRDDRCWSRDSKPGTRMSLLARSRFVRGVSERYERVQQARALSDQARRVAQLVGRLRRQIPGLDFAVMGSGEGSALPAGVTDLRRTAIDPETEREWCARAADSHVIVGVHGSHMLLPSGHAGATIEILPRARIGNVLQDLLVPTDDSREAMYCSRLLPLDSDAALVAETILSMLYNYSWAHLAYHQRYAGPRSAADVVAIRESETARTAIARAVSGAPPARFLGP